MIERPNIEWKDVPGFEGKFRISNYGDLICLGYETYQKTITPYEKKCEDNRISNSGYYMIGPSLLRKENYIHRLVAKIFLGNSSGDKNQINHKDGNKKNNFVGTKANNYKDGNLEWCSKSENMIHASLNNLLDKESIKRKEACKKNREKINYDKIKIPVVQLDMNGKFLKEYLSVAEAGKETGINSSLISDIARGKSFHKSVKGFQWVYKKDYNPNKDYRYHNNQFINTKKKVAQYDSQGNLIAIYNSRKEAAQAVGSHSGSYITECCQGKRETYKGFVWKDVE